MLLHSEDRPHARTWPSTVAPVAHSDVLDVPLLVQYHHRRGVSRCDAASDGGVDTAALVITSARLRRHGGRLPTPVSQQDCLRRVSTASGT